MANNKPGSKPAPKAKVMQSSPEAPVTPVFPFNFDIKIFILAVLSFIIYANTLRDTYCLDDGIVIEKNQYVQSGFDGIPKIMTTDAYDSYYKEMNAGQQLSGGRYRPLSEVVFAVEHAIFAQTTDHHEVVKDGVKKVERFISRNPEDTGIAGIRHLFSVLCFVLSIVVIFYFLSKYLLKGIKYGEDIAFFATLLFAIHPIHTEVVANVKSLDEILSILFICLTFIFSLRYIDTKKVLDLVIALVAFFLSMLAKEYAVTLIVLIPMLFYLLRNKKFENALMDSLGYFAVFIVYMFLRHKAVGFNGHVETNEILDNPYLLASHTQKIGTELFVLGKYLWMLIVPYPLVCDYSYAQIPYQNVFNPVVLFTVLLYIGVFAWGVWLLLKRNVLAFLIFFYLFCLALVSNLIMDIGATMGERLIFHSSLGFVILVSYGVFQLIKKWSLSGKRVLIYSLSSVLVIIFGYETMARNLDWKSDLTLFTHDVTIGPNSIMLNGNAGARYIDMAQHAKDSISRRNKLDTAILYLRKSIFLHKKSAYVSSYLNLGDAYYELQMPDSAALYWSVVRSAYPNYPNLGQYFSIVNKLFVSIAGKYGAQHNYAEATQEIYKAIRISPNDADMWYNLGGAYFTWGKYDSAYYAWNRTLQLDPTNVNAKKGMSVLVPVKKK